MRAALGMFPKAPGDILRDHLDRIPQSSSAFKQDTIRNVVFFDFWRLYTEIILHPTVS